MIHPRRNRAPLHSRIGTYDAAWSATFRVTNVTITITIDILRFSCIVICSDSKYVVFPSFVTVIARGVGFQLYSASPIPTRLSRASSACASLRSASTRSVSSVPACSDYLPAERLKTKTVAASLRASRVAFFDLWLGVADLKRALLIEASSPRRTACAEYLQARGIDTYTARGLYDARALLPALKPDVTALDPDLEDGDGLELIKEIVDRGSRCLVLSVREEVEYRIRALSLGADDYLQQPVHLEELFLRLRNILRIRAPLESGFKNAIVDLQGVKVDLVSRALLNCDGARGPELTETELSLLRILTDNVNRIVSKETLFATVYGRTYSPGTRSLDVGISRLRIKLKSTDNGAEIRSVREAGYLLARETEGANTKTPAYRHAEI